MVSDSARGTKHGALRRSAGFGMVILGWLFCLVMTSHLRQFPLFGIDYLSIYSSSRCLLIGCNPYSGPEMKVAFLAHGGTLADTGPQVDPLKGAFSPYYAGYPPTALFYFMPMASLKWKISRQLWIALSLTLYLLTALLFSALCSEYSPLAGNLCLACFLGMQSVAVFLLQPTLLSASLCCIGIWTLLRGRFIKAGIFCFALSLVLKPHLGAFALLYFFLESPVSRKRALQVVGVTVLLCVPALLWTSMHAGTRHWTHDYKANVKGVATRGHLSDPGPTGGGEPEHITDLQTIVSFFHNDPAYYNPVVWGFSLVLFAAWIYPVVHLPPSREKDLLCLAAVLPFSLLPIYHRVYDSLVLLAVFPAIGFLLKKAPRWGIAGASLSIALAFVISLYYHRFFLAWCLPLVQRTVGSVPGSRILIALLERPIATCLLILTVFFIVVLYRVPRQLSLREN